MNLGMVGRWALRCALGRHRGVLLASWLEGEGGALLVEHLEAGERIV